jgi:endonuclease-3
MPKAARLGRSAKSPARGRKKPDRAAAIVSGLKKLYPEATCELDHENAFQLLCATILSAQCTDARVNLVTPFLFRRWPTPAALAAAEPSELEDVIRSTGFFRNKTKSLLGMARALVEHHGGKVPKSMEEMLELPGVARKTANVVLGTAYGIASGVVVDTHVQRLSRLLGLTRNDDPKKIEADLMAVLPKEEWIDFSHRLIWHGRRVCAARKPNCAACPLPCPSRAAAALV